MTDRPKATSEWLRPLDQRVQKVDGPAPLSVKVAAALSVLLTPFMAYLTVMFGADLLDYAGRPGALMFVQVIGYSLVTALAAALTVGCPLAARRLLRDGDPKLVSRIGLLIGGLTAFTLALSIASYGRIDGPLWAQLGPAMLLGFGLIWLVRRRTSAQWLQSRRHELREGGSP